MTHGSPQGAFTHDRPLYYDHDRLKRVDNTVDLKNQDLVNKPNLNTAEKIFWYMQEYASPYAWENVLKCNEFKKLRLCIAHFGGSDNRPDKKEVALSGWNKPIENDWDENLWNQKIVTMIQTYPNLYTDLSCHDMSKDDIITNLSDAIKKYPDLRKRIMFGTDWYMTEMNGFSYNKFHDQLREAIEKIDLNTASKRPANDPSLFEWFSEINPFRFYRYDRIAKQYTKELVRIIEKDSKMKNKDVKIKYANKQKDLIYTIAKRLKTIGELTGDDVKTNDSN